MTTATDLAARARALAERELSRYEDATPGSKAATEPARKLMPLGVASNFQYYDPYPVVVARASGSRMWDVDGNTFLDFNMGYGSLLAGHSHPLMVEALKKQAEKGTLYVNPCVDNQAVAEELVKRFPFDMVRFTNSGTEATMDALRLARGATGRDRVVKCEGCYHGHYDALMISVKPALEEAGPPDRPLPVRQSAGVTEKMLAEMTVVPYNDLVALERAFAEHPGEIAAFILEPVPENMGIVLPDEGYLAGAIEICHRNGALIIFDEVKTGITAHPCGASVLYGLEPDIICLAKSVTGGVPMGAFGGSAELMDLITRRVVMHQGTFNGNPLITAAARSVLAEIITDEAWSRAEALNDRLLEGCQKIIDRSGLAAHTVKMGTKGCVTYLAQPVRNYRDYKTIDQDVAYAHWCYMIAHGIMLPPGLDEQWLISVQHTDGDIDRHLEVFEDFVEELTA